VVKQMKKGGPTTYIGRPIYGMGGGGNEMLMGEFMLGEKMHWN
jgi:hypothetical protein